MTLAQRIIDEEWNENRILKAISDLVAEERERAAKVVENIASFCAMDKVQFTYAAQMIRNPK